MSNWNLPSLFAAPLYQTINADGGIDAILYPNEPYFNQPTEVFAYMGIPTSKSPPLPAMVCVHGGGGTAFKTWVELWNARGYAAIAMDLSGRGIDGNRLSNGGPEQDHHAKFNAGLGWENRWTYHAVAAIVRAHSLLRSQPAVDANRIGITGISWGGYLTCIVAGVDSRFALAIPVYGCGFLQHNSAAEWMQLFRQMSPDARQQWHDQCDPSVYLPHARMPMLFVTGTNDFAYPLDSLKQSYSLAGGDLTLCVRKEMPHGHEAGWAPKEIAIFTDHLFRQAPPVPKVEPPQRNADRVHATYHGQDVRRGYLLYTPESGPWQTRQWYQTSAQVADGTVEAVLPDGATVYFLAVEDSRGAYASCPHMELNA